MVMWHNNFMILPTGAKHSAMRLDLNFTVLF